MRKSRFTSIPPVLITVEFEMLTDAIFSEI